MISMETRTQHSNRVVSHTRRGICTGPMDLEEKQHSDPTVQNNLPYTGLSPPAQNTQD